MTKSEILGKKMAVETSWFQSMILLVTYRYDTKTRDIVLDSFYKFRIKGRSDFDKKFHVYSGEY